MSYNLVSGSSLAHDAEQCFTWGIWGPRRMEFIYIIVLSKTPHSKLITHPEELIQLFSTRRALSGYIHRDSGGPRGLAGCVTQYLSQKLCET